jgi:hypothetical protein
MSEMACQTTRERKYQPWPGAVAAARDLRVTYSHLRRVLSGKRVSRSQMARYAALTPANPREKGADQ